MCVCVCVCVKVRERIAALNTDPDTGSGRACLLHSASVSLFFSHSFLQPFD
eukprot:COSAG03_NODE_20311_length_321_cov_0.851351_2_plen_50_part_01